MQIIVIQLYSTLKPEKNKVHHAYMSQQLD